MKITLLTIAIVILGTNQIFSQGVPLTGAPNSIIDTETWLERNKLRTFNENDETLGDRFLFHEWKAGSVQTTDSLEIKKIYLKYDLLFDDLIGKLNGSMMTLRKGNIQKFTLLNGSNKQQFETVYHNNKILFLEVIYSGTSIKLYKKHSVRLEQKDSGNQAYGSGVAYDKYVYIDELFLEMKGNGLVPIKSSKGAILKALSDRKEEIKEYIKSESINVKEEKDLSLVFKYYESIAK